MIHLICGPMGAGKTRLAHKLAKQHNAIRFSEDEWLNQLFVADAPVGLLAQPAEEIAAWASERYQRCRGQISLVFKQLLAQNINIVLDGAAANQEQRNLIRKKAKESKTGFQLYYVDSSRELRKQRVKARNIDQGETYSLEVTDSMFDLMEVFFEPPVAEELSQALVIST